MKRTDSGLLLKDSTQIMGRTAEVTVEDSLFVGIDSTVKVGRKLLEMSTAVG